jgi:hypothetical protein
MSYDDTARALEAFTDHVRFERLVIELLARHGHDVRPLGGSGDKGRDAVTGLYRAHGGEALAVTISLKAAWAGKITSDINRIVKNGFQPDDVISVTNRSTSETKRSELHKKAADDHKISLTINDVRWLIPQLHRRENLDLRGEYLHLPPPRPSFLKDVGEYEQVLERRRLISSQFTGRREEMDELERLLMIEGRSVILEAPGGVGKTRLAYQLAQSGRSDARWFFVDADNRFSIDYVAETEAGYEAAVLIDDAHRRDDLAELLAGLEQRAPMPNLVFTVRPGHGQAVETTLARFAFPSAQTLMLQPIGRSALVEALGEKPYEIKHEGMLLHLLSLSEGNIGIALLGAELALAGIDPADLSQSDVFAKHADWRLAGAGLDDRASRSALALVAALGSLSTRDEQEAEVARALLEEQALTTRLDELADAGLVVEDEPRRFTIKPDIVREHVLRSSFFPTNRRPLLRYEDVYNAFSPTRLRSLLTSLGDARVDLATGAKDTTALVRTELLRLVNGVTSADDLAFAAELVRALGPGGAATGVDITEAILAQLPAIQPDEADTVGRVLVAALSVAKFGRDQLPRTWRLLLALARLSVERDLHETRDAAFTEIGGIYSAAPINYSSNDPYVLAYVQRSVVDESAAWWDRERDLPGAGVVAAAIVRSAFTLQLEQHRQSAASAMSITLSAGFLPASNETEAMIRLGARLFEESLLGLTPRDQLKLLEAVEAIELVAGGYSGLFGLVPDKSIQLLAATVLSEVEAWLVKEIPKLSLPVAGAVVSHFAMRGRRPKGVARVRAMTPKGGLREFLDLVDGRPHAPLRTDWEKDVAETRKRAAAYGRKLARSGDWQATIERWSSWIDEYELLTGNSANYPPLDSALGAVVELDPARGLEIAEYIVDRDLSLARFSDSLFDAVAADKSNWPLIERWTQHPSANVRTAAIRAIYGAPDDLARPVLTALVADADAGVASRALQALMYGAAALSGWRIDLVLDSLRSRDDPLRLLDQLLSLVRHRTGSGARARVTAKQKQAIREIVVETARAEPLPSHQQLAMTLRELEQHRLDVAIDWLLARLEFIKEEEGKRGYLRAPPEEIAPFVVTRRNSAAGKRALTEFLDEVSEESSAGMYRIALDEAIGWLGRDSEIVTNKVREWIAGPPRLRELAVSFVMTSDWRVYTKRVKIVLDARPQDHQLARSLVGPRFPRSWVGNLDRFYLGQANAYRQWTRSRDPRLKKLGAEAVAEFERLAAEEAENERRLKDSFS